MDLMTRQTINENFRTSPEVFFRFITNSNFSYTVVVRALRPSLLSLLFLCLFVCLFVIFWIRVCEGGIHFLYFRMKPSITVSDNLG